MIKGINHIAIRYKDNEQLEKALSFYCGILGMKEVRHWGPDDKRGIVLDTGDGSCMELFNFGMLSEEIGNVNHFALTCDDIDGTIEKIQAAGYPITKVPQDICLDCGFPYRARIAYCLGPGGESIEFYNPKD